MIRKSKMAANVRVSTKFKCLERLNLKMRLVFEIFPSFCYRRTRNQILQLLLHGNYVVAVLLTGFGKYRSFAKQN